jgi:hypothetical protein
MFDMENDILDLGGGNDASNSDSAKVGNGEIVLVKLYSGDYVIGEVSTDSVAVGKLCLDNPRIFGIIPTMTGQVGIAFQPVCVFSKSVKKHIDINESEIMCRVGEDELSKELINGYKSEVTGIKIASASESAAINSDNRSSKGGDFIL